MPAAVVDDSLTVPIVRVPPSVLLELATAVTVCASVKSTSVKVTTPVSLNLLDTTEVSSVTAPTRSVAVVVVIVGASLAPVTVTVMVLEAVPSVEYTVKVSVAVEPEAKA